MGDAVDPEVEGDRLVGRACDQRNGRETVRERQGNSRETAVKGQGKAG